MRRLAAIALTRRGASTTREAQPQEDIAPGSAHCCSRARRNHVHSEPLADTKAAGMCRSVSARGV
jgi:hypothetical protein